MQEEGSGNGSTHAGHSPTTTDHGEDEENEDEGGEDEEEREDGKEFANSKELSSLITSQAINDSSTAARGTALNAAVMAKSGAVDTEVKSDVKKTGSSPSIPDATGATSGDRRDLSGIVMDVVILGAPLCSKVSGQLGCRIGMR